MSECCEIKHKYRTNEELTALKNRLSRIEGQVRGIKKMLENDNYCIDVMTQVEAVRAALNSFNKELLSQHLSTCVKENLQNGNDEVITELTAALQKLMK